jgi:hypothetical protein
MLWWSVRARYRTIGLPPAPAQTLPEWIAPLRDGGHVIVFRPGAIVSRHSRLTGVMGHRAGDGAGVADSV